jgi:uncharacterized protein
VVDGTDAREPESRRRPPITLLGMPRPLPLLLATGAGAGVAALAYGAGWEIDAYTVREHEVPVLAPGTTPLRLLHITDLHLLPNQGKRRAFLRSLADLRPDLVVNTGDTMASAAAIPAIVESLGPLLDVPGAFVPGNNDYFQPRPKNPVRYFFPQRNKVHGPALPWPELSRAMSGGGWVDLSNERAVVKTGDATIAFAGLDDPHLFRADYDAIAGAADPDATVRIGVLHSPEPSLISRFAADGYDLVLAGHTHGGQVRVPFGPAIVTNCGLDRRRARGLHPWDERAWFNVSAGVGTSPYLPIRFACRPEVSLLTLVPRS